MTITKLICRYLVFVMIGASLSVGPYLLMWQWWVWDISLVLAVTLYGETL